MTSISSSEHAARLLEHYIRTLVERSGLKWTEANAADFDQLAGLLGDAAPELESIPPYQPPIVSDRQTVILDQPAGNAGIPDPTFQKWRGQQRYAEEEDVRRLVRR